MTPKFMHVQASAAIAIQIIIIGRLCSGIEAGLFHCNRQVIHVYN